VKPFLLLASRAEDVAADSEYSAFLRLGGLADGELRRVRMEQGPMPRIELDDYSGIIVGGGPFNASDPPESKGTVQLRVERELWELLDRVVERDFPFLGACYGIGTLGAHQGGVVDRHFGESTASVRITLTADGRADPLFTGLPPDFDAYVGHKEACSVLPLNATLLASSDRCPIHAFRIKNNLYATQFHPELELEDLIQRILVYRFDGYFDATEMESIIATVRDADPVTWPGHIVKNFVERYRVERSRDGADSTSGSIA
jgi:GMP synthase (glutamine-hydrolysing)